MTLPTNGTTGRYMRAPRRTNKTSPLSHRLDPDMKDALQRLADADRRSLTAYIELILEDHLVEQIRKGKTKRQATAA